MWFSCQKSLEEKARREIGRKVTIVECSPVHPHENPGARHWYSLLRGKLRLRVVKESIRVL